jgi:uncharacterized LabA/DUF88 family protein
MAYTAESKIALLIDADNAPSKKISNILAEAGKHGKVTIRRIYGDWTDNSLAGWKNQVNTHAIMPIQKFSLGKGKNSTDTALIIGAMDILHSKNVNGICIASSDSDYTGLAQRIREAGIFVMGIGEGAKASKAFINACDLFVYTENLSIDSDVAISKSLPTPLPKNNDTTKVNLDGDSDVVNSKPLPTPPIKKIDTTELHNNKPELPINKITNKPIDIDNILKAYEMVMGENELAYMGDLGTTLRKLDPSFDARTYGSASMTNLFKRLPELFDLVYKDNNSALYIKLKDNKK